jgi:hypothetical protein
LTIDASTINADNYGSGPGGKVVLRGDDQLALRNDAIVRSLAQANGGGAGVILRSAPGGTLSADNSTIVVGSKSAGNSGKLMVSGGQVSLTNGAMLISSAQSTGNCGAIAIGADTVLVDGSSTVVESLTTSAGLTDSSGNLIPAGAGGPISVTARTLTMQNGVDGANFLSQTSGTGAGGPITISANTLTMLNNGGITAQTVGAGNGGSISVTGLGTRRSRSRKCRHTCDFEWGRNSEWHKQSEFRRTGFGCRGRTAFDRWFREFSHGDNIASGFAERR